MTKFRAGALLGLAAGFYLGTRTSAQRRDQINRAVHQVRQHSHTIDHAATSFGRAKAVVDLTNLRVHDSVLTH
jgi:hypothetical protein